ncbi:MULTISPECIES: hypothetical protein [Leptolyngbya]|uniref:hypothetical protein n=1 Tax=Leptolyngbya TaxID=47251 RepID=UPI00168A2C01|nr:hypothetical protein [Leptolyngbya sp. FACHB-1624]MBD1856031.1 hypothetical protein [Leptolyngbya sp. FACHB-1624]
MPNLLNRRQFLTLMGGTALLPAACQRVESRSVRHASEFKIFDALIYGGKPNVGLMPMRVDDRGFFATKERITPDRAATQKNARTTAENYSYFTIDIEHWKVNIGADSEAEVRESIDKFLRIIEWTREVAPSLKIGVYSIPPIRDYWTPVRNHPAGLKSWRAINQFLKPIADASDFITPSLYTFYDDVPGWVTYASGNIEEAQQFGKPVYPFLWCRYHPSNRQRRNQFIDGNFWRTQLETVRDRGANGLVLWDWAGHDNPRTNVLDTRQAWWQETVKFKATL